MRSKLWPPKKVPPGNCFLGKWQAHVQECIERILWKLQIPNLAETSLKVMHTLDIGDLSYGTQKDASLKVFTSKLQTTYTKHTGNLTLPPASLKSLQAGDRLHFHRPGHGFPIKVSPVFHLEKSWFTARSLWLAQEQASDSKLSGKLHLGRPPTRDWQEGKHHPYIQPPPQKKKKKYPKTGSKRTRKAFPELWQRLSKVNTTIKGSMPTSVTALSGGIKYWSSTKTPSNLSPLCSSWAERWSGSEFWVHPTPKPHPESRVYN